MVSTFNVLQVNIFVHHCQKGLTYLLRCSLCKGCLLQTKEAKKIPSTFQTNHLSLGPKCFLGSVVICFVELDALYKLVHHIYKN